MRILHSCFWTFSNYRLCFLYFHTLPILKPPSSDSISLSSSFMFKLFDSAYLSACCFSSSANSLQLALSSFYLSLYLLSNSFFTHVSLSLSSSSICTLPKHSWIILLSHFWNLFVRVFELRFLFTIEVRILLEVISFKLFCPSWFFKLKWTCLCFFNCVFYFNFFNIVLWSLFL